MSEAAIVISVCKAERWYPQFGYLYRRGPLGDFVVPGRTGDEKFGILVVEPRLEIQDIGSRRRMTHPIKAIDIAKDIMGFGDERKEKWGLLLSAAAPDMPRDLEHAIEAEIEFLNKNFRPPRMEYSEGGMMSMVSSDSDRARDEKIRLSKAVVDARKAFEIVCRKLVTPQEVAEANKAMNAEYQRMFQEAEQMFARPNEQGNITDMHRYACRELGHERPWCSSPQLMVDCPGCSKKIGENAITCGYCGALIDEPIESYAKMSRKERSVKLYPARYAEEDLVGAAKKK